MAPEIHDGLISVVIPTYNRAHCLFRAVDSVLAQNQEAVEVLVVDDGSEDRTRESVSDRYTSDARVRYIHQENGGVASARNTGLRAARGEYIAFLDSDDRWLPGKLALQMEGLRACPRVGMIWSDMAALDQSGRIVEPRYLRKMYGAYRRVGTFRELFGSENTVPGGVPLYCGDIFSQMVLGNLVHTSTVLLTRERAMRVGFFREDFRKGGEDYDFHLRVCREGPVAFVDEVTTEYQIGMPDALTRSAYNLDMAEAFLETFRNTVASERERITLEDSVLRECLADAYAWAGREALESGRVGDARRYFLQSLRERPRLRQCQYLAVSMLPTGIRKPLFNLLRALRKKVTRQEGV